jgi:hypothetical protein
MRLLPDEMILGAGMHAFSKPGLEAFRTAVVDDRYGEVLEQAVSKVTQAGPYTLGGESGAHPAGAGYRSPNWTPRLPLPPRSWSPSALEAPMTR